MFKRSFKQIGVQCLLMVGFLGLKVGTAKAQEDRIQALKEKAEYYYDRGSDSSFAILDELRRIGEKQGDTLLICYAYAERFVHCQQLGKVSQAFRALESYRSVLPNQDSVKSDFHFSLAVFYRHNEFYDEAIIEFSKAYQLALDAGLKKSPLIIANALGLLLIDAKRFEEGKTYLDNVVQECLRSGDIKHLAKAYSNQGYASYFAQQYAEAMKAYKKAYEIAKEHGLKKYPGYLMGYADCATAAGEVELAERLFNELEDELSERPKKGIFLLYYYLNKGRLLKAKYEYFEAEALINKALSLALEGDFKTEQSHCYKNLAELYEATNNYQKALECFKKQNTIANETWRATTKRKTDALLAEFNLGLKENQIQELFQDVEEKDKVIQLGSLAIKILLTCLVLVLLYLMFIAIRSRERKKAKAWLEAEVEKKTKEIQERSTEKSLMLKEIHHRVKNNMQLISSFIRLETHFAKNKSTDEILKEVTNRIHAISAIHEKLYHDQNFLVKDAKDFFEDIVKFLHQSFKPPSKKIYLQLEVENFKMAMDKMIPCGLIINELLSNSFKYGFEGVDEGEIKVQIKLDNDDLVHIRVSDNGVGLPDDFDDLSDTVGMSIIEGLVNQISGDMENSSQNGTCFDIRFPLNDD